MADLMLDWLLQVDLTTALLLVAGLLALIFVGALALSISVLFSKRDEPGARLVNIINAIKS